MRIKVADKQTLGWSLSFAVLTGILLGVGFLPTCKSLFVALSPFLPPTKPPYSRLREMAFFPFFAALLALSLPKPRSLVQGSHFAHLLRISLLPICISFFFGRVRGTHFSWNFSDHLLDTTWYLLFIPFGEEFLFRGWLYNLSERLWPHTLLTMTNPFPVSVWVSSTAFSLWHTQNLSSSSASLVFFQVAYTFLTGFWLGYLRWKSDRLWPGILAHFALNAVAGI